MIDNSVIEALIKIGNHKRVVKICEPNIMEPMELKEWMVRRTLVAMELFENEWKKSKKKEK